MGNLPKDRIGSKLLSVARTDANEHNLETMDGSWKSAVVARTRAGVFEAEYATSNDLHRQKETAGHPPVPKTVLVILGTGDAGACLYFGQCFVSSLLSVVS